MLNNVLQDKMNVRRLEARHSKAHNSNPGRGKKNCDCPCATLGKAGKQWYLWNTLVGALRGMREYPKNEY